VCSEIFLFDLSQVIKEERNSLAQSQIQYTTQECQTDLSAANEYELNKNVYRLTLEVEQLQDTLRNLKDKIKELKMTHRHNVDKLCFLFNENRKAFE